MTDNNSRIPVNITTQRLRVSDYNFPSQDGSACFVVTTNGLGSLSFNLPISTSGGVIGIGGSGQVGRIARWDGSEAVQTSDLRFDSSGDLFGVANLTVDGSTSLTGLNYPTVAGVSGNFMLTDGAGQISFGAAGGGALSGAGTENVAARWTAATTLANGAGTTMTIDDSGLMDGQATFIISAAQDFSIAGDISSALHSHLMLSTIDSSTLTSGGGPRSVSLTSCQGCGFASGTTQTGGSMICSLSANHSVASNYNSIIASEHGRVDVNNDQMVFLSTVDFSCRGQDKAIIMATSGYKNFPGDVANDGGFACIGCDGASASMRQGGMLACKGFDVSVTFGGVSFVESAFVASTSINGLTGNRTAVIALCRRRAIGSQPIGQRTPKSLKAKRKPTIVFHHDRRHRPLRRERNGVPQSKSGPLQTNWPSGFGAYGTNCDEFRGQHT